MGLATKQNNLTNPITGTGTTNFAKVYGTSTLGNSILSDSGGVLNVSVGSILFKCYGKWDFEFTKIGFAYR
jgi:hypothetical protein